MWLNLSLKDVEFKMKIEDYLPNNGELYSNGNWTRISCRIKMGNVINYSSDRSEIFLSLQIDEFKEYLKDFLNNELDGEITAYDSFEPAEWLYFHRYDMSLDADIRLRNLLNYFTKHRLVLEFKKDNLKNLYQYLCLITSEISKDDDSIIELINIGVLSDS